MAKRFEHLREDWKLVALALAFAAIVMVCYGWGVANIVASFETALGIESNTQPPLRFEIDVAKKVLGDRGAE